MDRWDGEVCQWPGGSSFDGRLQSRSTAALVPVGSAAPASGMPVTVMAMASRFPGSKFEHQRNAEAGGSKLYLKNSNTDFSAEGGRSGHPRRAFRELSTLLSGLCSRAPPSLRAVPGRPTRWEANGRGWDGGGIAAGREPRSCSLNCPGR